MCPAYFHDSHTSHSLSLSDSLCLSVRRAVNLSVYLFVALSQHMYSCLSVLCLSAYIYLSIHMFLFLTHLLVIYHCFSLSLPIFLLFSIYLTSTSISFLPCFFLHGFLPICLHVIPSVCLPLSIPLSLSISDVLRY